MNIKKRIALSIVRKPVKTIISFLVVLLLSVFLSWGISTHYATQQTEMNLRSRLPAVATLDWEHRATSIPLQTIEMIESIGALPYVLDYDIRSRTFLYADDLEWAFPEIDQSRIPESITEEEIIGDLGDFRNFRSMGGKVNMFDVVGIHNPYLADAQSGLISLTSGRFMTEVELETGANVTIISRLFADANNLDIGSTVTLENSLFDDEKIMDYATPIDGWVLGFRYIHMDEFIITNQPVELEVVGIFDVERDFLYQDNRARTIMMTTLVGRLYNTIYIPRQLQMELTNYLMYYDPDLVVQATEDQPLVLESVFLLHDPRDAEKFAQAAYEILPEYWYIYDASDRFAPFISSMDNMLWISNLIFYGALIATVVILGLTFTLLLHERRREIGIYLSLGESKAKIISQLLIEVLVVSAIAITFAFFLGNHLSQILSREMLMNELIRQEEEVPQVEFVDTPHEFVIFTTERMSIDEMISMYEVSLSFGSVALFFSAQLGSVLISSIIFITYFLRLDPKKFLTL